MARLASCLRPMHTPPIKAASWVVLYDHGPVRVPDYRKTRQDHVISVDLDRGCMPLTPPARGLAT